MKKKKRILELFYFLLNADKNYFSFNLAKKFNVNKKTIERYINDLKKIGIPILTKTGASGGYKIDDEYKNNFSSETGKKELEKILDEKIRNYEFQELNKNLNANYVKVFSFNFNDDELNYKIKYFAELIQQKEKLILMMKNNDKRIGAATRINFTDNNVYLIFNDELIDFEEILDARIYHKNFKPK